jgi:hypothetical protein
MRSAGILCRGHVAPAIFSIGVHHWFIGHPAGIKGWLDFLEYASKKSGLRFRTGPHGASLDRHFSS